MVIIQPEKLAERTKISLFLSGGLMLGLLGAALTAGWWSMVRGTDLLDRTDNPRRSIADRYVPRGSILDRSELPLVESTGQPGSYTRHYLYPALGPLVGYTDPVYGQAGLEASLDAYLRGMQGYPTLTMSWEHLLYGQPPPGLDVRLSLDLHLQTEADRLLAGHTGALVLLNVNTGEVVAMASSPTFDANALETNWESLVNDPTSPLFNRATMGLYPAGNASGVFLLAANPSMQARQLTVPGQSDCALAPKSAMLSDMVAAGCSQAITEMAAATSTEDLIALLDGLGLFTAPTFPVETLSSPKPQAISDVAGYLSGQAADPSTGAFLKVSPLQMALATASLSNAGLRLNPRLAMAVENPQSGWVMLPVSGEPVQALQAQSSSSTAEALASSDLPIWQVVAASKREAGSMAGNGQENSGYTWFLGGALPGWKGASLALVVLLESDDPGLAETIGHSIFQAAIYP